MEPTVKTHSSPLLRVRRAQFIGPDLGVYQPMLYLIFVFWTIELCTSAPARFCARHLHRTRRVLARKAATIAATVSKYVSNPDESIERTPWPIGRMPQELALANNGLHRHSVF